jgi:hypothetical protein
MLCSRHGASCIWGRPQLSSFALAHFQAATPTLQYPHSCRATAFAFGLATTLAVLGVASSLLGRTYGQFGQGLPVAVSLVAILMGLNLLEVVQLRLPSLDVDVRQLSAPPLLQAREGERACPLHRSCVPALAGHLSVSSRPGAPTCPIHRSHVFPSSQERDYRVMSCSVA